MVFRSGWAFSADLSSKIVFQIFYHEINLWYDMKCAWYKKQHLMVPSRPLYRGSTVCISSGHFQYSYMSWCCSCSRCSSIMKICLVPFISLVAPSRGYLSLTQTLSLSHTLSLAHSPLYILFYLSLPLAFPTPDVTAFPQTQGEIKKNDDPIYCTA